MSATQFFGELGTRLIMASQHAVWRLRMSMAFGRWMLVLATPLLALTATAWVYVLSPMRVQILEQQIRLEGGELMPRPAAAVPSRSSDSIATGSTGSALARAGMHFPGVQERTGILDAIYEAAPRHNIYLTQAQFHWTEDPIHPPAGGANDASIESVQVLELTMPVKGSYKDIREFVGDILQHNPSMALNVIDMARETPGGTRLVVDLRFELYLRGIL